jgi:hypothetical protein
MTADTQTAARKRGLAPILLGIALSLVIDVSAAEVASDNELYAACCIGVLQRTQQANQKLWPEYEQGIADDDKQFRDESRRLRQEVVSDMKLQRPAIL